MTEIEVVDPTHPLFGRRFPIVSVSSPLQGQGHVLVSYREYMTLRIPSSATNLALPRPEPHTKLTLEALTELISLAEQCEVLCPTNPQKSGDDSPRNSNKTPSTNSL
jgi:hypothetical protein